MSWHESKERLLKMISSAGNEFWSRSALGRPIKPATRVTLDDRWDQTAAIVSGGIGVYCSAQHRLLIASFRIRRDFVRAFPKTPY